MRVKYLLILLILPYYSCISTRTNEITYQKPVLPGIYQVADYKAVLDGKTIAVVANQASMIEGKHLIDTLLNLSASTPISFYIKAIFSPEHGFSGTLDAGQSVEDERYEKDKINIVSLYGNKKKPTGEDLEGIDVVVFDLQDVGIRFYTYISTLHYVMEACAENNVELVVLDRPNPHVNYIDGPILEQEFKSFVGMHPVPVVYGLTIGEYAQMINGEGWLSNGISCKLNVVKIQNFSRDSYYEFPVKPSPNLPNMEAIYLYPSLCFFEGTEVSAGRGTDFPFQVFGHPGYGDTTFYFTPESKPGASINPKFKRKTCYGKDLRYLPIDSLKSMNEISLKYLLETYRKVTPNKDFFNNYFDVLAGTENFRLDIVAGKTEEEIRARWKEGLEKYSPIRKKYLLYE